MSRRKLVALLREKNLSLAACESFTAGLFCSQIASVPGASSILKGGIVCYATQIKEKLLDIPADLIEQQGVVSAECARQLAIHGASLLEADCCVSFTGNAGPDAMEGKPAGLAYCAIAYHETIRTYCLYFPIERNEMRKLAVNTMIRKLIDLIEKEEEDA